MLFPPEQLGFYSESLTSLWVPQQELELSSKCRLRKFYTVLSWESPFPVAGWALAAKPEDLEPGQGQLFDFWLATPSRSPCSYDPLGRSDPLTYRGHVLLVLSH